MGSEGISRGWSTVHVVILNHCKDIAYSLRFILDKVPCSPPKSLPAIRCTLAPLHLPGSFLSQEGDDLEYEEEKEVEDVFDSDFEEDVSR